MMDFILPIGERISNTAFSDPEDSTGGLYSLSERDTTLPEDSAGTTATLGDAKKEVVRLGSLGINSAARAEIVARGLADL